jgi:hypothetical protein
VTEYRRARVATLAGRGVVGGLAAGDTWGQIVTPEELVTLLELDVDDSVRIAELVQITVEAYCWPNVIPDPIPPPVHAVGLALAARFAGAELSRAGSVVGESIGSYSYRLASPLTFDSVVAVLDDLAEVLNPWAPWHQSAFTLTTYGPTVPWPADWWQRDLDAIYTGWPR